MRRALWTLMLCAGCGGGPRGPVTLSLRTVAGGLYRGVCAEGDRLVATRAFRTERWRLSSGAAPILESRADVTRPLGPPPCPTGRAGPGSRVTWRRVPGLVRDATYDGTAVWAVADDGLWSWRPGPGEPLPVLLPVPLHGRPLRGIFRDGDLLWLRDDRGVGWPVRVRGPSAYPVGPEGELRPVDNTVRAPFGDGYVEGRLGGRHLRVLDGESRDRAVIDLPPLSALMPWRRDVLIVAAGDGLRALRAVPGEAPRLDAELPLGSPTVRLFIAGSELLAIGQTYGFARVAVGVSDSDRTPEEN